MKTDINHKKFFEWAVNFFLAVSFAMLSFYYMIQYEKWQFVFTVLLSFVGTFFLLNKAGKDNFVYAKKHPILSVVVIFVSVDLVYTMYQIKGIPNIAMHFKPLPFYFFRFRWWLLAMPALCYLLIWVWRRVSSFVLEFWKGMDQSWRKIYILITAVSAIVIMISYLTVPQWYLQYDKVYSIDSGWCCQGIFQNPFYYDIRHPVLGVAAFPVWAVVRFVLRIFVPAQFLNVLCVSCVQIINVQLLIFIGFMIAKLSQSKIVFFLYAVSSPVLLFSFFFEKYQICTFILVLYVYRRCMKERNPEADIILATGSMTTSFFLITNELFCREPWKDKIWRFCRVLLQGILLLVCTGRIRLLNPWTLLKEASNMAKDYTMKGYSVEECTVSFCKMVQGSFWGLSSEITADARYLWTNLLEGISIFSVLIVIIIVIGFVVSKKDCFMRFCAVWTMFAVVLFLVVQWSVHESPLFCIYFSWAFIPLFQKGLQYMIDKMEWNAKVVYGVLLASMVVVNVLNIADIGIFLEGL